MKTIRDYYYSPAFTAKATVLKLIPNGTGDIVILDRTIFCVQGGGQPADTGTIAGAIVTHVEAPKDTPDIIHHVVASLDGLTEGAEVDLRIDVPRRQLHSRLHTGGHLLAALVAEILPGSRACGGHHWPGEGRVEFIFEGTPPDNFEQALTTSIANAIAADFSVKRTISHDGERYIQIGEHPALRCGGTHCWHLKELGTLTLRGVKQKKDRLRIGYDVAEATDEQRCA
jgi:Ser-tRNA(Ala) deacylase AlaX